MSSGENVKPTQFRVTYRTQAGASRTWEGVAEDAADAETKALGASYESMSNDDHWHSLIDTERLS